MRARKRPQTIHNLETVLDPYDIDHPEPKMPYPYPDWSLKDLMFLLTLAEQPIRGGKTILKQLQGDSDSDSSESESDSSSDGEPAPDCRDEHCVPVPAHTFATLPKPRPKSRFRPS